MAAEFSLKRCLNKDSWFVYKLGLGSGDIGIVFPQGLVLARALAWGSAWRHRTSSAVGFCSGFIHFLGL